MCWPYRIIMYHQQNTRWYTQPISIHHHFYSWYNIVLQRQVKDTTTKRFFGFLLHRNKPNKKIPLGCNIKKLKDDIKQVVPIGVPLYGIYKSQLVRQLFFWQSDHSKYLKKLIKYQIIELENNGNVLKLLAESNYWRHFCPIEILVIFNKSIIKLLKENMSIAQHLSNYN